MEARHYTATDLVRMPQDGFRYELEQGRLVRLVPTGRLHWRVTSRLLRMLWRYIDGCTASLEVLADVFMRVAPPGKGETIKAPDLAVVPASKIGLDTEADGVYDALYCAPLLAVEVDSPGDDLAYTAHKIDLYLRLGVGEVWNIAPEREQFERHTLTGAERFTRPAAVSSAALPGFVLSLEALFQDIRERP